MSHWEKADGEKRRIAAENNGNNYMVACHFKGWGGHTPKLFQTAPRGMRRGEEWGAKEGRDVRGEWLPPCIITTATEGHAQRGTIGSHPRQSSNCLKTSLGGAGRSRTVTLAVRSPAPCIYAAPRLQATGASARLPAAMPEQVLLWPIFVLLMSETMRLFPSRSMGSRQSQTSVHLLDAGVMIMSTKRASAPPPTRRRANSRTVGAGSEGGSAGPRLYCGIAAHSLCKLVCTGLM